jgi:glucan 1,3-beta-glucosidase
VWQRLVFFPALALAAIASFAFWRWMGTPVELPDVPGGRLQCLSYTPFEPKRIGYNPQGVASAEHIEADMAALAPLTGCIRVYSALDPARDIVQAAQRHGIKVLLGAWIGGRSQARQNQQQIAQALALARRYPDTVDALIVGNEVLLRREMTAAQLAGLIRSVKAQSPVPVAYADVDHFIRINPEVAAAVDLALIHILPYWNDPVAPDIDEVMPYVEKRVAEFRALYPGTAIMVGETGWPSEGRRRGRAQPSLVNEARYVRTFARRAEALGLQYNLIEAIDQPWKRVPEGTVGGYWGVLDQFRAQKFPLSGPVSEWPRWREAWAITTAVTLAVLLAGALRRGTSLKDWLGLFCLAIGLGLALPLQWDFIATTSQTPGDWAVRSLGMAITLAGAAVLLRPFTGRAASAAVPLARLWAIFNAGSGARNGASLPFGVLQGVTLVAAAYISINLALAPRHLDIPTVLFVLPAIALFAVTLACQHDSDKREEALLAAIILVCGLMQIEVANPVTWSWADVCLLLGLSQRGALRGEFVRLRRLALEPREAQQPQQHTER